MSGSISWSQIDRDVVPGQEEQRETRGRSTRTGPSRGKPTGDAAAPPVSQKQASTEAGKRAGPSRAGRGGAGLIRHVYLGLARLGLVCRGHGCWQVFSCCVQGRSIKMHGLKPEPVPVLAQHGLICLSSPVRWQDPRFTRVFKNSSSVLLTCSSGRGSIGPIQVIQGISPWCWRPNLLQSRDHQLTSTNQSDLSELRQLECLKCFSLKH